MGLDVVKCFQTCTEDAAIDAWNGVKALTGKVEADELAKVLGVESKREYGGDCLWLANSKAHCWYIGTDRLHPGFVSR